MLTLETRWRPLIALLATSALFSVPAIGVEVVPPEQVGMSAERLERLTRAAEEFVEAGNLAGIVSLVARRGKIVYLEAVGYQDRERRVPMETDTIFRIASMTKPMTSLAILMLYEEGRLQLTDPLSTFVPEFSDMKVVTADGTFVDARRPITIHDLLTHNSGLSYHYHEQVGGRYVDAGIANGLVPDEDPIGEDVRALAAIPLVQQPGAGFHYGLSTDVLGHVVEVVSGQTLAAFFEERFFRPLGMDDTAFFLSDEDAGRLAQLYVRGESGGIVPENRERAMLGSLPFGARTPFDGPEVSFSGGGGLTSTCEDYFRFCQMVLQEGRFGGSRLVSRKTIEQASRAHVPMPEGWYFSESSDFGLGFAVQYGKGSPRPGSPGTLRWGGVFNTTFFIDPEEELIGISMGQLFPGEPVWEQLFQQLVYAAIDD